MRYVLRICDRCGAEIDKQRGVRVRDAVYQIRPELCESCEREVGEILRAAVDKMLDRKKGKE